jgi:hypothetical protein
VLVYLEKAQVEKLMLMELDMVEEAALVVVMVWLVRQVTVQVIIFGKKQHI